MTAMLTGFLIGLPLAAAVGPIALLLVESGMQHGVRRSLPAAFGVASADLALASVAAVGGTALMSAVRGAELPLSVVASLVLVWVAVGLLRRHDEEGDEAATAAGGAAGFARFLALTIVNPLTLLSFSSLVLAGGAAIGSPGWVIGMAAGSLVAQFGFVVVGALAGHALDARWTLRLRRLAGATILLIAVVHLARTL